MRTDIVKLILVSFFPALNKAFKKKLLYRISLKINKKLEFDSLRIYKFRIIEVSEISLEDPSLSITLKCKKIKVYINPLMLLKGKLIILKVELLSAEIDHDGNEMDTKVTTVKRDSHLVQEDRTSNQLRSLYPKIERSIQQLFKFIGCRITADAIRLTEVSNGSRQTYLIQDCLLSRSGTKKDFTVTMTIKNMVAPFGTGRLYIDNMNIKLRKVDGESNERSYIIKNIVQRVKFEDSKEGPALQKGHYILADLKFKVNESGFFLDKISSIVLDKLRFSLSCQHYFENVDKIQFDILMRKFSISDLVKTFLFTENGKLRESMFSGDFSFSTNLKLLATQSFKREFSIKSVNNLKFHGEADLNLNYLNKAFVHVVKKEGKFIRDIHIGVENPDFLSLSKISQKLIDVVNCTEDPNFFKHKGVDSEGIFLALAANLQSRRFKRGGSTITMQLAKNLFLNYHKSFTRKIEELLLTWLIEEVYGISKNRILEIYLNIIEFGPNIYGISAASRFYFNKSAESLTVAESLALSYIIPRPNFFHEALEMNSPQLHRNFNVYATHFAALLLKRKAISEDDFKNIYQPIVFANGLGVLKLVSSS